MEYERIHQLQTGLISPSKLRMKLMGLHHGRKKGGSNNNSSRTSPSKLEDTEFVKNGLLVSKSGDFDDEVATLNLEVATLLLASEAAPVCIPGSTTPFHAKESLPKENSNTARAKMQQLSKSESSNSSAIHPMRTADVENLDYDSNASSSSFEFHKERSAHSQFTRSFSRHMMPSKWNDAEKWIINRQSHQPNIPQKNHSQNLANRMAMTNTVRVVPESANCDPKQLLSKVTDIWQRDFSQPASQMAFDKFSFNSAGSQIVPGQVYGGNAAVDQITQSKDLLEIDQRELHCTGTSGEDAAVVPVIRSVCMRDMGTEMTPATSQEPSRTATPIDATTPLRSPTSSIPSTPRSGAPASTPLEHFPDAETPNATGKKDLAEQEQKQKTRREIVALGMQLGKMNIAAWASKADQEKKSSPLEPTESQELERVEYEKRAAAWEEAEKSKHMARYKRDEIKIQAWESRQKARLEAETRRIEAQVEQMRAQETITKKIALARQRSDEKRAAAEARKSRDAEQTAAKAEYIRRTGRIPSSSFICCGW